MRTKGTEHSPSARREEVLRGRAALRREQQRSAPPPKPTSLGTFLFGDKKVPRRRHLAVFERSLVRKTLIDRTLPLLTKADKHIIVYRFVVKSIREPENASVLCVRN